MTPGALIRAHGPAFGEGRIAELLLHYAFPIAVVQAGASVVVRSPCTLQTVLTDLHEGIEALGAQSVETRIEEETQLSARFALVRAHSVVLGGDGQQIDEFATSYALECIHGRWSIRIVAVDKALGHVDAPCDLGAVAA